MSITNPLVKVGRPVVAVLLLVSAIDLHASAYSELLPWGAPIVNDNSASAVGVVCRFDSQRYCNDRPNLSLLQLRWGQPLQQQVSNRCLTPAGACFLPFYAPIGSPCYCQGPYGSFAGRVG
jgi:hypothetical protein